MNTQQIFSKKNHRPLPMPEGKWIIYQEWQKVLFLHWAVNPVLLKKFVPEILDVQKFKGSAWVSLVVFLLTNVRPRYLPPVPYLSNANEINIRTYVEFRGKPGIYFLSMELGNPISNLLAKFLTGLPYRYSEIEKTATHYRSKNKNYGDQIDIEFEIKSNVLKKSELEKWLTERYALFHDNEKHTIIEYEIHHYEWLLHEANLKSNHINYDRFRNLIHNEPNQIHYSPGLEVLTWGRQNHHIN